MRAFLSALNSNDLGYMPERALGLFNSSNCIEPGLAPLATAPNIRPIGAEMLLKEVRLSVTVELLNRMVVIVPICNGSLKCQ